MFFKKFIFDRCTPPLVGLVMVPRWWQAWSAVTTMSSSPGASSTSGPPWTWVKRYIWHSQFVRGVLKKRSFYGQADHKGGQPSHGQPDRKKIVFRTPLMAKKQYVILSSLQLAQSISYTSFHKKTSQDLQMLSKSLSDCKLLFLNVITYWAALDNFKTTCVNFRKSGQRQ